MHAYLALLKNFTFNYQKTKHAIISPKAVRPQGGGSKTFRSELLQAWNSPSCYADCPSNKREWGSEYIVDVIDENTYPIHHYWLKQIVRAYSFPRL